MKHRLYIASTLSNWKRVRELITKLEPSFGITYDWTVFGEEIFGDNTPEPNFDPVELGKKAVGELGGVLEADYLLVVLPGGKGTHFEYGAFYVKSLLNLTVATRGRAPVTILDEENAPIPTSFHHLKHVVRTSSEEEAIQSMMEWFEA